MIHPRENHRGHFVGRRIVRCFAWALAFLLAVACQMALARGYENGGKLKFTLKVVDDEGKPVEGATVEVHLQTGLTIQGALFDTASDQKLKTDAEGRAVVSGKCVGEGNYLVRKDGFYSHRNRFELYDDKFEDGKWQPYGAERLVVLRKIRNPIRLHADYLENLRWLNHEPTPEEQTAIGKNKSILNFSWNGWLDLEAGDWIAPYGAGRTPDICLTVEEVDPMDESRPGTPENCLQRLRIHFSNPDDGGYAVLLDCYSMMPMTYQADASGEFQSNLYVRLVEIRDGKCIYRKPNKPFSFAHPTEQEEQGFFLRLRTVKDVEGRVVSAHYAKIYGIYARVDHSLNDLRFGKLFFFYNPNPNDTNLEYSPKENVFDDASVPLYCH